MDCPAGSGPNSATRRRARDGWPRRLADAGKAVVRSSSALLRWKALQGLLPWDVPMRAMLRVQMKETEQPKPQSSFLVAVHSVSANI